MNLSCMLRKKSEKAPGVLILSNHQHIDQFYMFIIALHALLVLKAFQIIESRQMYCSCDILPSQQLLMGGKLSENM